ncbi:thioredoxin family protein [Parapedobacter sp. DT-150]|uniref:thioredoxin family protein n=1 Tax=Parapedobacter sp. DT-150 TaxID=3396162 RepID=UPI003F1BA6B2
MLSVKRLMLLVLMISLTGGARSQVAATPIGDLTDSIRIHPKPALILITTGWCTYCHLQKAQLKKNKSFQQAASQFYFTEVDAESKAPIAFNGSTYQFNATGVSTGLHELSYALGNVDGRLAFPTWVLINEHFEILFKYPGVLRPKDVNALLDAMNNRKTLH